MSAIWAVFQISDFLKQVNSRSRAAMRDSVIQLFPSDSLPFPVKICTTVKLYIKAEFWKMSFCNYRMNVIILFSFAVGNKNISKKFLKFSPSQNPFKSIPSFIGRFDSLHFWGFLFLFPWLYNSIFIYKCQRFSSCYFVYNFPLLLIIIVAFYT